MRIGRCTVVVTTAHARIVVQRDPFRLSVQDAAGRRVLREVRARRGRPARLRPTNDPEVFGGTRRAQRPLYAPLTYVVGRETLAQWTGLYYAGDLLFARRAGVQYHARHVLSARRRGAGARLVVASDEPGGRRILMDLGPDSGGLVRVRARLSSSRGVVSMADSFASGRDEAFHGFGGRHWGLDQRGREVVGWIEQENVGGARSLAQSPLVPSLLAAGSSFTFAGLGSPNLTAERFRTGGNAHYGFPGGPNAAYYAQELFVSSWPYGFLLNTPRLARWRMALDRPDAWQVAADGPGLDFTVAPGHAAIAARALTAITGRHQLPPRWAEGPILWRLVRIDGTETAARYAASIDADLDYVERHRVPLSGYGFEGWELLGSSTLVRRICARLRRDGIHPILYARAFVSNDPLKTENPTFYDYAIRHGLVARRADGTAYRFESSGAPAVLIDFTNPAAVAWWKRRITRMLDLGADGFMEDFGEQTQAGMRFHDGSTGASMHNRYPVLYHRISRRLVDAYDRAHHRRTRTWFFTRAGFSGRPGSTGAEMGNFPGDETTEWGAASGLRSLAPDMLNRAIGGAFGYSTDIGGYIDRFDPPPDAELFTRWTQWSALTPYFRVHNSAYHGTRTPWSFGVPTYRRWLAAARLHDRALAYVRRLWRAGRRTGIPPTRPLWLAGVRGRRATAEQEWLLGDDVLVAPVVARGARSRNVVFPRGCWASPGRTGARFSGPVTRRVSAPLDRLPWFVRCGTRPF